MHKPQIPDFHEVDSSQIKAISYDAGSRTLYIEFRAKTRRSVYQYANVGPELAAKLIFAESKGSVFARSLKSAPELYPYRRLEDDETVSIAYHTHPQWLEDLRPYDRAIDGLREAA